MFDVVYGLPSVIRLLFNSGGGRLVLKVFHHHLIEKRRDTLGTHGLIHEFFFFARLIDFNEAKKKKLKILDAALAGGV